MTGPEHYRMAQDLVTSAGRSPEVTHAERTALVQMAQVHATLAQAAATADHAFAVITVGDADAPPWMKEWAEVTK